MSILSTVGRTLQRLFGDSARRAGDESGVIQRKRKFTAASLARTFVLGFLQKPSASDEDLAQMAAQQGVSVTPQAIDQRHTPKLVAFLKGLFQRATQEAVGSDHVLAAILKRFTKVIVLDSSTIRLPDSLQDEYRGCGGSHGSGKAALKLQTELDLRSGALANVQVESGRSTDGATTRQQVRHGPGSLRISDLGYFNIAVFAAMMVAQEHFLSRLQFGTHVLLPDGTKVELLSWLAQHQGFFVDQRILLGQADRLACRLIAWKLPPDQANRRRRNLRADIKRKSGGLPTAARLAWCDWTILVTSVLEDQLTPTEATVLYRARWQVELLFKRWKSQNLVAELSGSTVVRQMVRLWARFVATVVQHWLILASVWGDPTKSLSKACEAVRQFVGRLAAALESLTELERVLADLRRALAATCGRNPRSNPGTFELLNDPEKTKFR
jgi:hypothetical protein